MKVGTLPVLDDLMEKDILFTWRLNPARDFGKAGGDGRMVTSFAADDLVNVLRVKEADGNGLENAEPANGFRELLLSFGGEVFARLGRVGPDTGQLDEERTGKASAALAVGRIGGGTRLER